MDGRTRRTLEAMRWLIFGDRRPGALGRTTAFLGMAGGSPYRVELSAEGWRGPDGKLLNDQDLVKQLISPGFGVKAVAVIPEVAPLLFQGGIEQVEAAHRQLMEAAREIDIEGDVSDESWLQFIMATSALDKSLRHSSAAVMLCLAAAEAQVNAWAESLGGWGEQVNGRSEDWLPLVDKLGVLSTRKGRSLDKGRKPISDLAAAVKLRNELVHSKPVEQSLALGSLVAREPARWLCVEARRSAIAIRECLVRVSAVLGEEPPHYLIYCPEADPEDDEKWVGVVILTGVRDDSVFPKVSERYRRDSVDDPGESTTPKS